MKTIAYLRVSTDKQTIENQRNEILNYSQKEKILIDEFIEIEISSRKSSDARLINELKTKLKKDDRLIVTELSRLGRSTVEVLSIIDNFVKDGITIVFIKQNLTISNNTEDLTSKIMITLFSLFAELERDLISKRTKEALASRKAKGAKLGHKKDFLKSKYDEHEQTIYNFREYNKLSFNSIVNLMDTDGKKGFKAQSLRTWFNKRYQLEKAFNTYQKTESYKKHLEDLEK